MAFSPVLLHYLLHRRSPRLYPLLSTPLPVAVRLALVMASSVNVVHASTVAGTVDDSCAGSFAVVADRTAGVPTLRTGSSAATATFQSVATLVDSPTVTVAGVAATNAAATPAVPPSTAAVVVTPAATMAGASAAVPTVTAASVAATNAAATPAVPPSTAAVVVTPAATMAGASAAVPTVTAADVAATNAAATPAVSPQSGTVAPTAAAFVASASVAATQARARAANVAQSLPLQRLRRYAVAVNGGKVADKTVSDLASLMVFSGQVQDAHPGLRVLIHLSGVSAGGELSWASLFGDGCYVDPDVLRVFGQAHQFCRGRDLLTSAGNASSCLPARLVGTHHRGGVQPMAAADPPPSPSSDDLAFLDAMVAPQLDNHSPSPIELQRLARMAARAEAASRSPSPPSDGIPPRVNAGRDSDGAGAAGSGDAVGGGDGDGSGGSTNGSSASGSPVPRLLAGFNTPGVLPFVFESVRPPARHVPSTPSLYFMENVLDRKRRGPILLLRNVLRAAVLFFSMTFNQRGIQEGFSRWWAYQLIIAQEASGELPKRCQWPLSVVVPTRFLTPKTAKKLPAATMLTKTLQDGREEEPADDHAEDDAEITPIPKKAVDPAVLVELRAIPTNETHCKQEEAVAAILLLWDKEPRSRSCMMSEVFRVDQQTGKRKQQQGRRKSAATSTGASARGAVALAPRTGGGDGGGGAGRANAAAGAAPPGLGSAAAARAHARRAASGIAATDKRALETPAAGCPAKRTRLSGGGVNGAGAGLPAVIDGPCDLLDERGITVATGVADVGRRVLHTRAVPSEFLVIEVKEVAPSCASSTYPYEQQFPVEPPSVPLRLMRDTVGTFIVWNRASVISV